jgi:hypothetical protein
MKTMYASLAGLALLVLASTVAQQPPIPPPATVLPGNSSSSSPGSAVSPLPAPAPDALVIVGDRLYLVRDGQAVLQDRTYTMTISANGLVGFDGRRVAIPQGSMVTMSGRMVPIPANLPGLPLGIPTGSPTPVTSRIEVPDSGAPVPATLPESPTIVEKKPAR